MKVMVDTPIWSLAFRRSKRLEQTATTSELASLVEDGRVALIGPIRQELLSGVKDRAQFERLREHLRAFSDTPITMDDYEEAAGFYNRCRAKGIQGSNTDFLICAIAARNDFPIFTTDKDFEHFASLLPIRLHELAT
jgi:predicted nucleic acid-binding protein